MGSSLLVFAVVMACLAVCVVVACMIAETTEAWRISHEGWTRGHRQHQ